MLIIAGPCVIESESSALAIASELAKIADELGVELIFKASFDKANRSSALSPRGPGLDEGIRILRLVKQATGLATLTDIHEAWQAGPVAEVVDVLQIPAFLCRQTELIQAAAATGKRINIKKGQFLAPADMAHVVAKAEASLPPGASRTQNIMLTERGSSFGYHDLVVDMRSLAIMAETGCPVIFDATHSVQRPGGLSGVSGGDRHFVPILTRAAAGAGIDGLFVETHPDPPNAVSDASTAWPLAHFKLLIADFLAVHLASSKRQLSGLEG
jgi:2-dehydro-3-deoxyphosphooctonate aldolase (KDO 8-P synthase)